VPHNTGVRNIHYGFLVLGPATAAVSYVEIEAHDSYREIQDGYATIQVTVVDGSHKFQDVMHSAEAKVPGDFRMAISGMPQQSLPGGTGSKPGDTRGVLINRASSTVTFFENGVVVPSSGLHVPAMSANTCVALQLTAYKPQADVGFIVRITAKPPPASYAAVAD
jgi:hypothetical protein